MLRQDYTHYVSPPHHDRSPRAPDVESDSVEAVQLLRLAGAVLDKSPEDLVAIAESNPLLIQDWLEAFRMRKQMADVEARYWSAAMAALSTAVPETMRTAAE